MILVTTDSIQNMEITQTLGMVKGSSVKAKHLGKDIRAAGRTLIGGEMTYYTDLLNESRDNAVERMVTEAKKLGANAIINIRFNTAMVMQGSSEVLAYGTAVKVVQE